MDVFEHFPCSGVRLTMCQSQLPGLLPGEALLCVGLVDVVPPSRSFSKCLGGPVWPSLRCWELCSPSFFMCSAAPGQLLCAGSERGDGVPGATDSPSSRARVHLQILSPFS